MVRQGSAFTARVGIARHGRHRQGKAGRSREGVARLGKARRGEPQCGARHLLSRVNVVLAAGESSLSFDA